MHFILTTMLTLVFGLSMLQCQSSTTSKPETVKTNTQTANTAPAAKANTAATEHIDAPADDAPRISLADAKKEFDSGKALFIDTRGIPSYQTEHIKGAINIPVEAIYARITEVPKNKKVIAYCS